MTRNPNVRPLDGFEVEASLAEELIGCADDIRQCYTDFGLRPYRAWLTWVRYTADVDGDGLIDDGEELIDDATVGAGRAVLVAQLELLPTPLVTGLGGVAREGTVTGNDEGGGVSIVQISAGYPEDLLRGLMPDLVDLDAPDQLLPGLDFFYEIQEHRPAGYAPDGTEGCDLRSPRRPPRRRFHLTGVPTRSPDGFQWMVDLTLADGATGRDQEVEDVLPPHPDEVLP